LGAFAPPQRDARVVRCPARGQTASGIHDLVSWRFLASAPSRCWTSPKASTADMRSPPMSVSHRSLPNVGQALQEAVTLQQQGRLREAEKIYTRVLKALPDQFDALNLLGTIKAQRGQAGEAYRLITAALKVNPRAPDAWVNLGIVLHAL